MADAHCGQFDQHLVGAGIVDGLLDDFEIRSGFFDHGDAGLIGHDSVSFVYTQSTARRPGEFRRASPSACG